MENVESYLVNMWEEHREKQALIMRKEHTCIKHVHELSDLIKTFLVPNSIHFIV